MFCSLSLLLIWDQPKPSGPFNNYNNENRKVQQWNATKCRYCIADCPAGLWLYRTGWRASTNQRAGMWVVRTVRRGGAGSNRTTHRCTSAPRPLERSWRIPPLLLRPSHLCVRLCRSVKGPNGRSLLRT